VTFSFSNNADDYLGYHMYMASQSGVIVRRKKSVRYIFAIIYMLLGIYFSATNELILGAVFIFLGIIWFVFFPSLNKTSSSKFYRKYILENYKNKLGRQITLVTEPEYIFASDGHSESKVPASEFEKLIEIRDAFYLKLKSASSFIVPKAMVDPAAFKSEIAKLGIPLHEETGWAWK
jgi:hypothetical protein